MCRNTLPTASIHASSCPQKEPEKKGIKRHPAWWKIKVCIYIMNRNRSGYVERGRGKNVRYISPKIIRKKQKDLERKDRAEFVQAKNENS